LNLNKSVKEKTKVSSSWMQCCAVLLGSAIVSEKHAA